MMRKFVEGLAFGAGFAISYLAISYFTAFTVTPMLSRSVVDAVNQQLSGGATGVSSASSPVATTGVPFKQFHELGIDEKMEQASIIAIAKYEKSRDGKVKAIIKEFLKKQPGTEIYYNIGDEYPSASYYPKENVSHGDGVILFFAGSPATMKVSYTYAGDRILALGDMPIALFRKKFEKPKT